MLIVGLNAYHGDVAAVVLRDGVLVAALEEERFTRVKHASGFPARAIAAGLAMAGARADEVDVWALARGRRVHLLRKAWFALWHRPGAALVRQYRRQCRPRAPSIAEAIGRAFGLDAGNVAARMRYVEHHPAHLASAFHMSGMPEAACCAIDGFGDFVSVSVARGHGTRLDVLDRVYFPHSLGLLYLAITQYLGFKKYGDEYKVMGLAPYGKPSHADAIGRLLHLEPGGGFRLDLEYFRHWTGDMTMAWEDGEPTIPDVFTDRLIDLLGPARRPDEAVTGRHEDLAASVQCVFEEAAFHVLRGAHARVPVDALCLAGGCAMNSVANGKIRANTPFRDVFIQPAAGDNGTALGAALDAWHAGGTRPAGGRLAHSYWGTEYDAAAIARRDSRERRRRRGPLHLDHASTRRPRCAVRRRRGSRRATWWAGSRAAWNGGRARLATAASSPIRVARDMRDIINQKIKFRERFRPFAPSILAEAIDEYFVGAVHDPFMLQVYPVRPEKRGAIPAVTHVDGSGRLQSVSAESNPRYWALLRAFQAETGVPVLLNTSFNENEPIVERPEQALDCFLRTDMDLLVMGPHVLRKPA